MTKKGKNDEISLKEILNLLDFVLLLYVDF